MDKYRYGDKTTEVQLRPCIIQLDRYAWKGLEKKIVEVESIHEFEVRR